MDATFTFNAENQLLIDGKQFGRVTGFAWGGVEPDGYDINAQISRDELEVLLEVEPPVWHRYGIRLYGDGSRGHTVDIGIAITVPREVTS